MLIIGTIRARKSLRSYLKESLKREDIKSIKEFIDTIKPLFGAKLRIELIETNVGDTPVKLGTYGVVSGAKAFLAIAYKESLMAEEAAGHAFEQVILLCTDLGLGTCWMGGTFNKGDFASAMKLEPDETLRIISPVGYKADSRSFVDVVFGAMVKHNTRKDFETLFFDGDWSKPLSKKAALEYATPLEMVHIAPSARNRQPWRVLFCSDAVHFYRDSKASDFTKIDMGIALCHFELACRELGINGEYVIDPSHPLGNGLEYVVSWVR